MNYCSVFIVVALILAIIRNGEAGTSLVDIFTKLVGCPFPKYIMFQVNKWLF